MSGDPVPDAVPQMSMTARDREALATALFRHCQLMIEDKEAWDDLSNPVGSIPRCHFWLLLNSRTAANENVQSIIKMMAAHGLPKTCDEKSRMEGSEAEIATRFADFFNQSECKDEYKKRLGSSYARLASTGRLSKEQSETELEKIRTSMKSSVVYKKAMVEGAMKVKERCSKLSKELQMNEVIDDEELTDLYTLLIRSHSLGELLWESDQAALDEKEKKRTESNPSTLPVLEL